MKRITRKYRSASGDGQVWVDQFGHWTKDEKLAFEFEDDEANRRVRRIPFAELEDVTKEESK